MASIEHAELLKRLRGLSKALRKHCTNVNRGGCGVVAGEVGLHLQSLGVPVEVVTPAGGENYYGNTPKSARELIEERWGLDAACAVPSDWDDAGLWRSHLAIRFVSDGRLYTWDSEGLVRSARRFGYLGRDPGTGARTYWHTADYPFGEGLTPQEAAGMSEYVEGWNRKFNRDQIPLIQALAQQHILGDHHAAR